MLEPVYFNTQFIYRFGTEGVTNFGGEEDGMIDIDVVTWKECDIPIAQLALNKMRQELNLPEIDLSSYEKNKSGTQKLVAELVIKGGIPNGYLMGCVICHQLLYKMPLQGTFMTGQPNSGYNSDCDTYDDKNSQFQTEDSLKSDSE